ncbi:hypothetical protein HFP51_10150 [Parasphingopyxis sp. CP4]|uniref:hypothetical protein n=1 Tax=Parasphingopyxis sp. CP4 TaxID=2724527 RepID=UPI0015A029AA|nr:hypothetical protein [Parasphingopyxis sp. CP4]QLC22511.1 hypothetical protein HFP51_10150 [Parasphingopyxis sp. CP4]
MALYDKGSFWIAQDGGSRILRYELRSWYVFVSCLAISSIILSFGIGDLVHGQFEGLSILGAALLFFGFMYGLNVAFAKVRVAAGIKRAVTEE